MANPKKELRGKLDRLCREWIDQGLPSIQGIKSATNQINQWKQDHSVDTIWSRRPVMVTATLDDGIGQGLEIIHHLATTVGMDVNPLGLLVKPDKIIKVCQSERPEFVGLTVLQLDSEENLQRVGEGLPAPTRMIAGGPVFSFDPEMAQRCRVSYVAENAAYFIDYLLKWFPDNVIAS